MPRRFTQMARDIWQLQSRLRRTKGNYPQKLLQNPKFRAGYDFLLLRTEAGENEKELADWWTAFLENPEMQQIQPAPSGPRKKRRRGGRNRTRKPAV